MMGVEKRHGKNKPVITKALTDLEGKNFKTLEALRGDWAIYDCYRSQGPIQFDGPTKYDCCHLVKEPEVDEFRKITEECKAAENNANEASPYAVVNNGHLPGLAVAR